MHTHQSLHMNINQQNWFFFMNHFVIEIIRVRVYLETETKCWHITMMLTMTTSFISDFRHFIYTYFCSLFPSAEVHFMWDGLILTFIVIRESRLWAQFSRSSICFVWDIGEGQTTEFIILWRTFELEKIVSYSTEPRSHLICNLSIDIIDVLYCRAIKFHIS